jgi:[ribosomal protein S18]-alanine N-acetyltransferase
VEITPSLAGLPLVSPMTPDDLDAVIYLERQCFEDPWTRHMYLSDLTQNDMATYRVLRPPPRMGNSVTGTVEFPAILGYGGFWLMVDEAHIATIASHPQWRGCGLGQWLLLALLEEAIARGASRSTLEVRVGNVAARALYAKVGYQVAGARRHYYRNGEDGLIMTTPLLQDPSERSRLDAAHADALVRLRRCLDPMSAPVTPAPLPRR